MNARAAALALAFAASGCYGGLNSDGPGGDGADDGVADSSGSDSGDDDGGDDGGPAQQECEGIQGAPTAMARLTQTAYLNAVQELLGIAPSGIELPDDPAVRGFLNDINRSTLQVQGLQQYMNAAEDLADEAIYQGDLLPDCGALEESPCIETFILGFGERAFRRPVTDEELASYLGLFESGRVDNDFAPSVSLVVQAVLQAPAFLYWIPETEAPDPQAPDVLRLTDHAFAARLALLVWDGIPDADLLAAADAGELATPEQIEAQVRRMMDHPRFADNAGRFHTQWLDLHEVPYMTRDDAVFPAFDDTVAASMLQETEAFSAEQFANDGRTLQDLLLGTRTYVNGPLAEIYGVAGPADATTWEWTDLDASQRAGLLTQPSVLAARSHEATSAPVLRGVFVRDHILCAPMPPPPADLDTTLPPIDPDLSTRERYDWILEQPACSGCHVAINPFGYVYENFDAIGQWRDEEAVGTPIDASGAIVGVGEDIDQELDGPVEMAQALSDSEEAAGCYVENWYRYSQGRELDDELDECGLLEASYTFEQSGRDLRSLVLALATSEAMRYTTP